MAGITVIDDFLPSELFTDVLAEFHDKASHQDSPSSLSSLRGPKEVDFQMNLPASVLSVFCNFLTGSPMQPGGKGAPTSASAEMTGHLFWGEHKDHHDVTCTGAEVSGEVCALYLGGSGTLVFTDKMKEAQHRIQIRPNVAVKWPNADYTHRVEALVGDGPRMMLGPYTVDGLGGLKRTMSPKGMGDGFGAIVLFFAVFGIGAVLICGGVVQHFLRLAGLGIRARVTVALGMILAGGLLTFPGDFLAVHRECVSYFLFALALGTLVSGAIMNIASALCSKNTVDASEGYALHSDEPKDAQTLG